MIPGNDFHLHFVKDGKTFDVDFREQLHRSPESLTIDGRSYALAGEQSDIDWLLSKIPELKKGGISRGALSERIRSSDGVSQLQVVHSLGLERLRPSSTVGYEESVGASKGVVRGEDRERQKMLKKVVDHALRLLYPEPSEAPLKADVLRLLQKDVHSQRIERARKAPLPGAYESEKDFPKDTVDATFPPIIKGLTKREVMILGAVATILDKNDVLKKACRESLKAAVSGKYYSLEDGREIHYESFGKKSSDKTCTIMMPGMGDFAFEWKKIQEKLGDATYGISYSRAGLGPSEMGAPDQASISKVLEDFHAVLTGLEKRGEIQSPYLLVGHSLGSVFIQLYAHQYPDNVNGIVLVDSTIEKAVTDKRISNDLPFRICREFPGDNVMPVKTAHALFPQAALELGMYREVKSYNSNVEQFAKVVESTVGKPFLGSKPLIVLCQGAYPEKGESKPTIEKKAELELRSELADRSTNSKLVVCDKGIGHYIQRDAPEVVVGAIRELL